MAAAVTAQVAQEPSTTAFLTALSGLAIPATAVIVLLGILILVPAVVFGGFEFVASYSKFSLSLKKRDKPREPEAVASPVELAVEEQPSLPPPPPAKEVEAQATPPEDDADNEKNENDVWLAYFHAKTLPDLDAAYPAFRAALVQDGDEFWETEHRKRRADLGADSGTDGVRELIAQNPTWAFPFSVLMDWSIKSHDYEAATGYLEEGLKRQTSPQFGFVLSGGVRLKFLTGGHREALRFCVEYAKAAIPERIRAGAFNTLAELLKDAGHIEGYRVAMEWAICIQPSDKDKAFHLAYSYAEANSHWPTAMWHYRSVLSHGDDGPVARNNLGILLGHFDKAAQIDAYERAAAGGDRYAPANLANLLISDGYIAAAERLLKSVADPGDAAELHSRAHTSAMETRRRLEAKTKEITSAVDAASKAYRVSVAHSLKRLQSDIEAAAGFYASADNLVAASIGSENALVRLRLGHTDYQGVLIQQATCFAGKISNRADTILGGFHIDVTLIDEGDGVVRLFQWPGAIGEEYQSADYELRRLDVVLAPPPLPAPQTNAALGSGLAALFAAGTTPTS